MHEIYEIESCQVLFLGEKKFLTKRLKVTCNFRRDMEANREEKRNELDLSAVSMDTLFTDDADSLHDLSISKELEKMVTSPNGAFDGDKFPSKFEFNCKTMSWLDDARTRCDKRFERGLGVNLIKSDELELKPV